ncbi:MAG TPA: MipA/OmpV family protein [Gammaproteobacteria bacterium]|nr:MipA/OmpV family protein [Gammaproteobacteria bacterium]
MNRFCRLLFLSACCLMAFSARAADEDPQEQLAKAAANDAGAGWIFGAGVAVTNPGYVGYSRQITPLPLVFYHYGRFFFAGFAGGYLLSNGDHYRVALVLQPTLNRLSSSDSPELAGIQNRQWSLAGGANLETFGDWGHLNVGVFHDLLDRNNGTSANLGYRFPFHAGAWTLSPGIGLRWEDSNLTDYYYGVSAAEARPSRPAYSPGSATSPYASLGVSTPLSEHWQVRGDITYLRFGGAIHDSPIVDRSGSPTIFIGFVYNPHDR